MWFLNCAGHMFLILRLEFVGRVLEQGISQEMSVGCAQSVEYGGPLSVGIRKRVESH